MKHIKDKNLKSTYKSQAKRDKLTVRLDLDTKDWKALKQLADDNLTTVAQLTRTLILQRLYVTTNN